MRSIFAAAFVVFSSAAFAAPAITDCPAPPPVQRNIIADSYYDDPPVYSHIDPVKHAAYEAAVKPLETYLSDVAKMASAGDKQCTLRWLIAWAEGDALLGKIEKEQAHYERKWLLAGLALSYAKVRDAATTDQRASIDAWVQALAGGVRRHSDAFKGTRNNHYYWEGLAVGATGAVTGNAKDLDWARKVFRAAEADIADDGTLPLEMKRGSRALHYHLFSAAPLVMLESILDEHSAKIEKLVAFCNAGKLDLDMVSNRAGVSQLGVLDDDYDWEIVWQRHNPPKPGAKLHYEVLVSSPGPVRKPIVNRLGGDLSESNPLEHVNK